MKLVISVLFYVVRAALDQETVTARHLEASLKVRPRLGFELVMHFLNGFFAMSDWNPKNARVVKIE